MKKSFLQFVFILFPIFSFSQKVVIKDVNLEMNKNEIIVNYNITDNSNGSHHTDFLLLSKKRNFYIPDSIKGNIGTNTNSGHNEISFDMLNQTFPLAQELRPSFVLDHNYKKGSKTALLSALLPGLGDYFVEDYKEMSFKPYYRTFAFTGFFTLALIANNNRLDEYKYVERTTIEMVNTGGWGGYELIEVTSTFREDNPDQYWLFKNDTEVFLGVAASIWIYDIIWVYLKGRRNQNIKRALSDKNYSFNLTGNGVSFQVNLN